MAEEIKKVVKIDVAESSNSVKALREQVEKLRDVLKTLDSTSDEYKTVLGELKTAQDGLTSALKASQDQAKNGFKLNLGDSPKTVKGLKEEIKSLQDALLNITPGTDEYSQAIKRLVDDQTELNTVMNASKTVVGAAEGSYAQLSARMTALKRVWKATNDEATRTELGKEIKTINDELKRLDLSIGNAQRNVGNYAGSFQALRQEIKDARDIMAGAARGSDEYAAAAQRAAEASDKLRDMQKEIANGASGLDNKFSVTAGLLGNISGGFAAVQGAMALFGEESEDLQKTFVKLQAAMSMTQGLKALAELPKGLNAAKIAFGGAATGVRNFIKSLNLVKGAIAATGIGLLLVLLGELIANWDKVTESVSNFVGGMDGLTEKLAGVANVIKNFITGPIKALGLALKGNFKEAWETMKNGFNVSANYVEGRSAQMVKNVQKNEQKKREEYDKTKNDYIQDMEAQYGADWKYSKEGQKAYRELYNNKLKMYKKDSEEYKKAQRDMWSYERELREKEAPKSTGGSSKKSGKSEVETLTDEMEKFREELAEAQKKGREAINEVLSTENQKKIKEYQDKILELGQGIQKAFEIEPLLSRNNKVLSQAEGILAKYNADIAGAFNYNLGRLDVFYDAIKTKNTEIVEEELKTLSEKLPADVFETVKKATTTIMRGTGAALGEYTDLIIKGVGNLNDEEKKVFDTYKELIGESKRLGYISSADIISYYDAVIKVTKDFEKEEKNLEKNQAILLESINEHLNEVMNNAISSAVELQYEIETLLNDSGFDRLPDEVALAVEHTLPKIGELLEKIREDTTITYNHIIQQIRDYKEIINSTATDGEKLGELMVKNEAMNVSKRTTFWSSFLDWKSQEDRRRFDDEITYNNKMLIYETNRFQSQIKQKQIEMGLYEEGSEERKRLAEEISALEIEMSDAVTQTVLKNQDIQMEKYREVAEGRRKLVEKTAETIGNVGEFLINQSDILTKKYKKDGEWQSKEKEKQAERMFKVGKALAISEAVVSTYQGAQESYTSLASIPYVGPALGIAAAAAAITAGMLRIQSIASQKFGDDGNVSDSSGVNTVSAVAVPQLESTPYQYTQNVTNAEDEDKLNQPIIVQVSDVDDALKVRESRSVETSF